MSLTVSAVECVCACACVFVCIGGSVLACVQASFQGASKVVFQ